MQNITQERYKNLIKRQQRVEEELDIVKKILREEIGEGQIKPSVLKRWERISKELDQGKGHRFSLARDALLRLRNL